MRRSLALLLSLVAFGVGAPVALGQSFTLVYPRGAEPGTELDVTCYGRRLTDTIGVVTFRDGLEVLEVEPLRDDRVRVRLRVAPDCPLGPHALALHTRRGLSRARTFDVAPLPTVRETRRSNDRLDDAQPVSLEVTIDGRILAEDVDWYAFDARAGDALTFEVVGVRLGDIEFDPVLELFDSDGRELARADDSAFGRFDPVLRHAVAEDSRLYVRVRDVGLGGNSRCFYRLHAGTFPRPIGALPCGGRIGEELPLRWLGEAGSEVVHMPSEPGDFNWFPRRGDRVAPTPIHLRVGDQPVFTEGSLPDQPVAGAFAWHGVIGEPREEDRFLFRVTKGERVELSVRARSLRSPLDAVIRLLAEDGEVLAENDDSGGPDSRLRFTAKSDRVIQLAIRDQLGRGGPEFFYRVETAGSAGTMSAREAIPGRRAEDFGVAVPRGGRNATMIAVSGLDSDAGIRLDFGDLPPGVRCEVPPIPVGFNQVPVLFMAEADAPMAARMLEPRATAEAEPHERSIRFDHEVPLIRVRNDRIYTSLRAHGLPIAVTEESPFAIEIDVPEVPLVRGAPLAIPFRIARAESFDGDVVVRSLWVPSGVSAGAVRAKAKAEELAVPLSARSNAAVGRWPMILVANAGIGGVNRIVASPMFELEVCDPWVSAKVGRIRAEQGQVAELAVQITGARPFEGELELTFEGLPRGVTIELPRLGFDDLGDFTVPVRIDPDAPAGRHRRQRLRIDVPSPRGSIRHAFGGGEVRIDTPLPSGSEGGG